MIHRNVRPAQAAEGSDPGRPNGRVVEPPERLQELRQKKRTSAGWTLKGIPPETIEIARHAALQRGMRIGSWVAECLRSAASRELEMPSAIVQPASDEVLKRLDVIAESIIENIKMVSAQTKDLDQELGVIRRGLLPKLTGTKE